MFSNFEIYFQVNVGLIIETTPKSSININLTVSQTFLSDIDLGLLLLNCLKIVSLFFF